MLSLFTFVLYWTCLLLSKLLVSQYFHGYTIRKKCLQGLLQAMARKALSG